MLPRSSRRLADLIRKKRRSRHLSARELARMAGVDVATVTRLELAQIPHPRPDSLKAIAGALDLRVSDLFAVADWVPRHELPSLLPYLHAKYRQLPDSALREIGAFADRVRLEHGDSGPLDGEDES